MRHRSKPKAKRKWFYGISSCHTAFYMSDLNKVTLCNSNSGSTFERVYCWSVAWKNIDQVTRLININVNLFMICIKLQKIHESGGSRTPVASKKELLMAMNKGDIAKSISHLRCCIHKRSAFVDDIYFCCKYTLGKSSRDVHFS